VLRLFALGHKTDLMSDRYAQDERKRSAAREMGRYAAV
jgi:hypothetical protein